MTDTNGPPTPAPAPLAVGSGQAAVPATSVPLEEGIQRTPATPEPASASVSAPSVSAAAAPTAAPAASASAAAGSSVGETTITPKKRKWYGDVEAAEIAARSSALRLALALDQQDTLYPAPPSAFTSFEDAVERLLPYHIWQIHDDELDLGDEAAELKESSSLVHRLLMIRRRHLALRMRPGHHPSDLPSLISLINSSTAQIREELTSVQATLRAARGKYETIEAEARRVAEAARREREKARADEDEKRRAQGAVAAVVAARAAAAVRVNSAALASPATLAARQATPVATRHGTPAASSVPASPVGTPPRTPAAAPSPSTSAARPIPNPASAPIAPSTPTTPLPSSTPSTPFTPTSPGESTPGSSDAALRGRPRGRPRGRGRGGLREAVLTHGTMPGTGTASPSPSPVGSPVPAAVPRLGQPGKTPQPPILITVAMNLIPQFVASRLIIIPADPTGPKAPATVVRTSDDKKNVTLSIDLGACNQQQLQSLARLLNVQAKPSTPTSTPSTASTGRKA